MRSKNSVPVQIILPGRDMGNRQSVHKAAFEEALHSTIEANLRTSGNVTPSHIFSSLYLKAFSNANTSVDQQLTDRFSDKNGSESKPDISLLQKQNETASSSEPQALKQETLLQRSSQELQTGVSPFVPTPFVTPSSSTGDSAQHKESAKSWLQPTPTEHNSAQQQIALNDARVEHFKKMQQSQLHTWKLLQQQQQLQKRMIPRNANSNTLLQAQMGIVRTEVPHPKTNVNGIPNRAQFSGSSTAATLPSSPMFRKGYCKGGRDIRLSTLENNSSNMIPYPSTFALVAFTISSVPLNNAVANDALVVAAVSLKFLPPYQQDTSHQQGGDFAQCVGCGDQTLINFAMLASHGNLRLQTSVTTGISELLRRHARYFVVRNPQQPHTLVKGAVIPWNWSRDGRAISSTQADSEQLHGTRMHNSMPMLVAPYVNMYMAHAAAAKQTGNQPNNHMLYPSIVNKLTSSSAAPVVINDDETSKISSTSDTVVVQESFFSELNDVPVLLNVIPNTTIDLRKNLKCANQIHVFDLHEIFKELLKTCNFINAFSTSQLCKIHCFSFFLYLNSLGPHEPVSRYSYSSFMCDLFETHSTHLTSVLENVSPINTLALAQMFTQNVDTRVHVSQESFGHALQTFFNTSSHDDDASFHMIAHANETDIAGMCLVIKDAFLAQLTQESFTSSVGLHSSVISNIKKVETAHFKEFWSLMDRLFPHKPTNNEPHEGDEALVIDTDDAEESNLSSRQLQLEQSQLASEQHASNDINQCFTEKVLDLICDDSSPFHLMHFSGIRCRFILPAHNSCMTQAEFYINNHGLLNICGDSDLKQLVVTATDSRLNSLQDEIRTQSSELFIIFLFSRSTINNPAQSPPKCETASDVCNKLLNRNVLFIQSCDNHYFTKPKINNAKCNLFVNFNKHRDYLSVLDHCALLGIPSTNQQTLTHCEQHEAKWRSIVMQKLDVHSYDSRASLVLHEYTQAMFKIAKTQQSMTNIAPDLHGNTDSASALNIVSELVSLSHISCVLRIPSMSIATLAYLQLRDVRDRLNMTKQFEIILYNPSVKPSMSNQYLSLLQERRNEVSTWRPSQLYECNCIPVLVIYAGDICLHHQMPSSLRFVDLRLSWMNAHPTNTSLESEMSLLSGFYRLPSAKQRVSNIDNDDEFAESPPSKKRKENREEEEDQSEVDSTKRAIMAWKSVDNGSPIRPARPNGLKLRDNNSNEDERTINISPSVTQNETTHILPRPPTALLPKSVLHTLTNHSKNNLKETLDDKSSVVLLPATDEAVVVNVAFRSRCGTMSACCGFARNVYRMWKELRQIEVFSSSCAITPLYPVLSSSLEIDQPDVSMIREMPFNVMQPNHEQNEESIVIHVNVENTLHAPGGKQMVIPGNFAAFNRNHKMCDKCLRNKLNTGAEIYSLSIPNIVPQLLPADESKLIVELIIPKRHSDKFVFANGEVLSIKFQLNSCKSIKTPVLSFAVSGAEHGLYNLNHTLATASGDIADVLHMLVVRNKDADSYRASWPNLVMMILPEEFDYFGVGAMKYAAHKFFMHCYDIQLLSMATEDTTDILWPFILFIDDNCALWRKYNSLELCWQQASLYEVVQRLETFTDCNQVSAMGVSPWRSQETNCSVVNGNVTNRFSRCNLSSCFAVNAKATKDNTTWKYDMSMNVDLDFCLSAHSNGLLLLQFNDVAVTTKVIKSRHMDGFLNRSLSLVSTADSDFDLIDCHPRLLLEAYLSRNGTSVFDSSSEQHPIATIDGYMSFGSSAFVEYVSTKSNTFPEKLFGGLFLNSPLSDFPVDLLQKLQFIEGAIVCVVDKDRNSLRQTVVNLNLERRWHFRLTDEFQTTNKTDKYKPLFFLTGIFKN